MVAAQNDKFDGEFC